MKKQTLTFCKGLPASGKSTWAKQQAKLNPKTVIVNRDKIREMLKGEYKEFPFGTKTEELVTEIEQYSINVGLQKGYDVISDNTNFRLTDEQLYKLQLFYPDIEIDVKEFDIDLKTAIQRDQQREVSVGKLVIERMYKKYIDSNYEIHYE